MKLIISQQLTKDNLTYNGNPLLVTAQTISFPQFCFKILSRPNKSILSSDT